MNDPAIDNDSVPKWDLSYRVPLACKCFVHCGRMVPL